MSQAGGRISGGQAEDAGGAQAGTSSSGQAEDGRSSGGDELGRGRARADLGRGRARADLWRAQGWAPGSCSVSGGGAGSFGGGRERRAAAERRGWERRAAVGGGSGRCERRRSVKVAGDMSSIPVRELAQKLGKLLPSSFCSHVQNEFCGGEKLDRIWTVLLSFCCLEPRNCSRNLKEVTLSLL